MKTNKPKPPLTMKPACTVTEYAELRRISPHQVRGYIDRGELEAIDTSERGSKGQRPRWKITAEAIERFEAKRSSLARRANKTDEAPQPLSGITRFI